MKVLLVCLFFSGVGMLQGEKHEWEKKKMGCDLELVRNGEIRKGVEGFELKVELTYVGPREQMVSRAETINFILVTKDGNEIPTKAWGADGVRGRGLSDYRMLINGDSTVWKFGASVSKRNGKMEFVWSDPFGAWHGCRLDSMDGVRVMVQYVNQPTKDLVVKDSWGGELKVPRDQIWSGKVRSKMVWLVPPHADTSK